MADGRDGRHRVAVVQVPPVVLDRAATLELVVERIDETADAGARLVAFGETFVPGYPEWIWGLRPGDDGILRPRSTTDFWTRRWTSTRMAW